MEIHRLLVSFVSTCGHRVLVLGFKRRSGFLCRHISILTPNGINELSEENMVVT
jgi:hypothetical protein